MGRSRGIGRRHRWEVGTEETNEVDALREPAAGRGQESEDALPSLPGGDESEQKEDSRGL